jgi:hypothetical protein
MEIHSVTIKFPTYDITAILLMPSIGDEQDCREKVYLYDMQVSTCLVDVYEDYNCFGEVSFLSCQRFQKGTKSSD